MISRTHSARAALAALFAWVATVAYAAGPSGTEGAAEMEVTGTQFAMLLGGAAALGIVIWLVIRFLNK